MIEIEEMNNTLKKIYTINGEYYSLSKRRNNTIDLTTSNNRSLFNYSDLSVGIVHYDMEVFGEN